MKNVVAAFAFSVLVALMVYNAQLPDAPGVAPEVAPSPIPKIEQRTWPSLASPAVATPANRDPKHGRDLFAAP